MFLWAILHQRQKMALYFWERADDSLILSLIACCVYQNIIKNLAPYDTETEKLYQSYIDQFESLAVSLLEECNNTDPVDI